MAQYKYTDHDNTPVVMSLTTKEIRMIRSWYVAAQEKHEYLSYSGHAHLDRELREAVLEVAKSQKYESEYLIRQLEEQQQQKDVA